MRRLGYRKGPWEGQGDEGGEAGISARVVPALLTLLGIHYDSVMPSYKKHFNFIGRVFAGKGGD